jgi:hypothetical protein
MIRARARTTLEVSIDASTLHRTSVQRSPSAISLLKQMHLGVLQGLQLSGTPKRVLCEPLPTEFARAQELSSQHLDPVSASWLSRAVLELGSSA